MMHVYRVSNVFVFVHLRDTGFVVFFFLSVVLRRSTLNARVCSQTHLLRFMPLNVVGYTACLLHHRSHTLIARHSKSLTFVHSKNVFAVLCRILFLSRVGPRARRHFWASTQRCFPFSRWDCAIRRPIKINQSFSIDPAELTQRSQETWQPTNHPKT